MLREVIDNVWAHKLHTGLDVAVDEGKQTLDLDSVHIDTIGSFRRFTRLLDAGEGWYEASDQKIVCNQDTRV